MRGASTRRRAYGLRLLLGGLTVVCLQAVVFLLILDDTVGGVSLSARERDPSMLKQARAVVLRSTASAGAWSSPERYEQRLRAWIGALDEEGLAHQLVSEGQLDGALRTATVLVLPGAACLAEPAREAAFRFLAKGGGLVLSGAAGTRDGRCEWRGFSFLERATGGADFATVSREGTFAAFRGGQFYDGAVPVGYRLALPFEELVVTHYADADAYWSDWRLRPARGTRTDRSALALHRTVGAGRVVWFGLDESPFGRSPESQAVLEAYLGRAAAWASREALGTIASWPEARTMAAVVAVVVGDDLGRVQALKHQLDQAGVPTTWIADPGHAARLRDLGATDVALHVSGEDKTLQRLDADRALVAERSGLRVNGLEMAGGVSEPSLRSALAGAGFRYSLDELSGLRGSPDVAEAPASLFSLRPPRELVRVFRVAADHAEVLANYQGLEADRAEPFLWDLERLQQLGGLYPLVLHSDLVDGPSLSAVRSLADRLRGSGAWTTTAGELADWCAGRRLVGASVHRVSPYRVQLDLDNHGHSDLKNVPVFLHLGYRPERVALRSPVFRLALPRWTLVPNAPVLRLDFPEVRAQSNYTYVIALDE